MKFTAPLLLILSILPFSANAAPDAHPGSLIPVQYGRDDSRGNDQRGNGGYDQRGDDRRGGGLPGGSWNLTCRNPDMRGSTLRAECQDGGGRWRGSAIDLNSCAGNQVANRDGGLICEARGGGGLPGGSWNMTCRRPDMRGSTLRAECQDGGGHWRGTALDINTCRSNRAANRDGGLICE